MKKQGAKTRFVQLRAEGHSFTSIAHELGVHRSTLSLWAKELVSEIEEMRKLEFDHLLKTIRLDQRHRLTAWAQLLNRIHEEVTRRDISDVPTNCLVNLALSIDKQLAALAQPPAFEVSRDFLGRVERESVY